MSGTWVDVLLVLAFICVGGVFAATEIALVSLRSGQVDRLDSEGAPSDSKAGAKDGANVEAPKAAEKKPATVTPICTAERNRLGSRASEATA